MNTAKKLSIRLEAVGGDKVRQEFKNISSDGQKAFQRITQIVTPANDNLKVLDNTAKAFNNTLKRAASLAGAYLGLRGLTSAFKGIVQTNKEFERLIGSLKTVTVSLGLLRGALALIGGPAGAVLLLAYGLYKLVDSHDVAKRAAKDHAETLDKLKKELADTVKETTRFYNALDKNKAVADWSLKLKTAEKNIKDLNEELKRTGGLSFMERIKH